MLYKENWEEAKKRLDAVYKALDKAAIKKYIHKNKASRKKSRFGFRGSS